MPLSTIKYYVNCQCIWQNRFWGKHYLLKKIKWRKTKRFWTHVQLNSCSRYDVLNHYVLEYCRFIMEHSIHFIKLFSRAGKLTIKCSTLVDVIVTDNWIIKVSPYGMDFAHQSDARIKVDTADTHQLGISGTGTTQFLNIRVSYSRRGNHCFYLR